MYQQCYQGTANSMLGDLSGVSRIYLVTGYTDMRKSIDGLMSIIRDNYELDPYSNSLFLFCGKKCDRIKALHYEKSGFILYYKRLDCGSFQWPRKASEARPLTRQEFHEDRQEADSENAGHLERIFLCRIRERSSKNL